MTAGKYRERISVEQKADPRDAAGTRSGWSEFVSRRAEVVALSGREGVQARQVQGNVQYLITIRADAVTKAITPAMRVVWNGKTLGITAAILKDEEVELSCGSKA